MAIRNDALLRALKREPVERTPVWFMRQAGRYLPEYQAIRKNHDFLTMIRTPSIAAEVTVQPVDIVGVDAAILFSDILVVPEAMGMALSFDETGPHFADPIRDRAGLDRLEGCRVAEKLRYVVDAIGETRRILNERVPLIGFAGAPWTLAAFMVEGKSPKESPKVLEMVTSDPETLRRLLERITGGVIAFLKAQADAGVNAIQIFDTLAGLLPPEQYREFGLPYVREICAALRHEGIPRILFAKGQGGLLEELARSGADALSIDAQTDIGEARRIVGATTAIQGNLDPESLLLPVERIRERAALTLEMYGSGNGHIFNLGHGVPPVAPVDHVRALVDIVHDVSRQYHRV